MKLAMMRVAQRAN